MIGESTVSTGKPGFSTPPGHYHIISKDRNHVSSEFGDYVDDSGKVVKSNVDSRSDSQPPGTHFDGAQMRYCIHFNGGYAMHEGYVPRYAASHGCIRLPKRDGRALFRRQSRRHAGDRERIKFYSPSNDALIRVYDNACNVIETHEHAAQFKEPQGDRFYGGGGIGGMLRSYSLRSSVIASSAVTNSLFIFPGPNRISLSAVLTLRFKTRC